MDIGPERGSDDDGGAEAAASVRWHHRVRRKAKSNPATDLVWRAAVLVVGGAVLLAGVVMIVTPGPGWAAIFLGLAILSSEFAWAHRLLSRVKATFRRVADQANTGSTRRKMVIRTAGILVAAVAVVAAVLLWQSGVGRF